MNRVKIVLFILLNIYKEIISESTNKLNLDKEADLYKLLDQWKAEDDLPDDDTQLTTQSPININDFNANNPEEFLQQSKKGRTLLTFVSIDGDPTAEETESISRMWQSSLHNNHILLERYVVDKDRVLFSFHDGSQAWQAKDFLVNQDRCKSVTIENKVYENLSKKVKSEL